MAPSIAASYADWIALPTVAGLPRLPRWLRAGALDGGVAPLWMLMDSARHRVIDGNVGFLRMLVDEASQDLPCPVTALPPRMLVNKARPVFSMRHCTLDWIPCLLRWLRAGALDAASHRPVYRRFVP